MQRDELARQLAHDLTQYDMKLSTRRGRDNANRLAHFLLAVDMFAASPRPPLEALASVFTRRPDGKFDLPPVEKLAKKLR